MNYQKLRKLLDDMYEIPPRKRKELVLTPDTLIELIEAIIEDEYDKNLGKTESSD